MDLDLLLTCRQIYNESVLVPFSASFFSHDSDEFRSDGRTKLLFLRDLIPDQSRAISTLQLRSTTRPWQVEFVQQHINTLSGLRKLILTFDWNMMGIKESPDQLVAALEDRFDATGVSMFATANLQTVEIKIGQTVSYLDVQAVMEQKDELIAWIEGKRDFLLTKQSPVRRTRHAAVAAGQTLRVSQRIQAQKEKAKMAVQPEDSQ